MSSSIVSSSNENKAGEITHRIHEIGLATVIGNVARSPEVHVKNVKWAAEGPREDELAVTGDGAVGGDAMRALKNPGGDIFAAHRPEEAETDAVEGFINTHVTGRRRGMVGGEDITAQRRRDNDEHQHFRVVLNRLEHDNFAVVESETILTDIITVSVVEGRNVSFRKWSRGRQAFEHELSVGVLLISRGPVERRRNRTGARGSVDKRASDKFGRRIGSVDRSEEVNIDEVINNMGSETERAASGQRKGVGRRIGGGRNSIDDRGRDGIAGQ
jgi:hypothetical protein